MAIWILRANGSLSVSENFRHAMRTAATMVFPDERERAALKRMDRFPSLTEVGAQGTFHQLVRAVGRTRFSSDFSVEEHSFGGPPGTTLLSRIDLVEALDPSFEVQVALWDLAAREAKATLPEVAAELMERLEQRIDALSTSRAAKDAVDEIVDIEDRFGGIAVTQRFGRPEDILRAIPADAARIMNQVAFLAFGLDRQSGRDFPL